MSSGFFAYNGSLKNSWDNHILINSDKPLVIALYNVNIPVFI